MQISKTVLVDWFFWRTTVSRARTFDHVCAMPHFKLSHSPHFCNARPNGLIERGANPGEAPRANSNQTSMRSLS